MFMVNKHSFEQGQLVSVKVNGELVEAAYEGWHEEYNMAIVLYKGKRLYRKVYLAGAVSKPTGKPSEIKQSRFDVNTRFKFIEDVVDMVVAGESKSVIISGSGGLGKTYTVMARLKQAELNDFDDVDADEAHYVVFKGFSTPKSLYRLLYTHRERIVVFDDMDSVWDNPTAVSLLKAALDSYETRRISWLSELRNDDDDLPQSFEFKGKVIFVSNLSLTELDQAVLSRSLYVDVSMTAQEKIERIKAISGDIRPDMRTELKTEALDLLKEHADSIGDLNIRTFLKVLEIRQKGAENWRDLAEYVITAL
jgi:hypothetical protein